MRRDLDSLAVLGDRLQHLDLISCRNHGEGLAVLLPKLTGELQCERAVEQNVSTSRALGCHATATPKPN